VILKPGMVMYGEDYKGQKNAEEVADMTVHCLMDNVPASIGAIAFLSGGQSSEDAVNHLKIMHMRHKNLPWPLSFSYGRALHAEAMTAWGGKKENIEACQNALITAAEQCHKAIMKH